jgi:serine/threonine protein kinase
MSFRVPAPDGSVAADRKPRMVLPDGAIVRKVYELHYLASGGMGVIYKARKGQESFIVKEVDSRDGQGVVALTQEMTILQRLDDPGIVKVFELFEEDGFFYLVEEFIDGTSLDRLIPSGSSEFLPEELVLDWAMQLYDIFDYLHRQKPPIIYRDLKPQNSVKDSKGRIRLVDFGLARLKRNDQFSDTMKMGTTGTASPEHYGGRQTDARSDIYTLGATLHLLLTNGRGSGRGLFRFEPLRAINPHISESLEKVIHKALNHEPEDRFQSIDEMRQATLQSIRNLPAAPGKKERDEGSLSFVSESGLVFTMETPEEKTVRLQREGHSKRLITVGAILCLLFVALMAFVILGVMSRKAARQASPVSPDSLPLSMRGNPDGVPPPPPHPGTASPAATIEPAMPTPFFISFDDPSRVERKSLAPAPVLPTQSSYPSGSGMPQRPRTTPENSPADPQLVVPSPQFKDIEWFLMSKKQLMARLLHIDEECFTPPRGKKKDGRYAYGDGKGTYYEIDLPEGYMEMGEKQGSTQFVNLEKSEGKESLRLISVRTVNLRILGSEGMREATVQKYANALKSFGATVEKQYEYRDATKIGFVYEYRFTPKIFNKQMYFLETAFPKSDGNEIYLLTTCSSPESFSKYRGEFEQFNGNFYGQNLWNGL